MLRLRWWLIVAGALSLVGLTTPASAQDSPAARDSAIAKLRTGQQIRISADGMSRLIGRAGVALDDTLDFAQDDAVRRIPIPAIDTLWVRDGSATTGAIVGAGAAGLFVMGVAAAWGGSAGLGFLTGATIGAVLGGFIGGPIQSWKRRYP